MYKKSEHPALGPRYSEKSGAATVAKVMAKAEASHAAGAKTTEGANFKLEANQAKHTTESTPVS